MHARRRTTSTWMRSICGVRAGTAALAARCEFLVPEDGSRSLSRLPPPTRALESASCLSVPMPIVVVELRRTNQPRVLGVAAKEAIPTQSAEPIPEGDF
jgi:hypothetical protein